MNENKPHLQKQLQEHHDHLFSARSTHQQRIVSLARLHRQRAGLCTGNVSSDSLPGFSLESRRKPALQLSHRQLHMPPRLTLEVRSLTCLEFIDNLLTSCFLPWASARLALSSNPLDESRFRAVRRSRQRIRFAGLHSHLQFQSLAAARGDHFNLELKLYKIFNWFCLPDLPQGGLSLASNAMV